MQWDYADRMRLFYNQTSPGNEPSVYTHYLYDAGGNRVKKLNRTEGGYWESITYIDGLIEYREDQDGNEQSISHVTDSSKRIASIREGYDFGDSTPAIKYNLDDHLGSSNVLVDSNGTLVNFEEYYPFGETSFGSYAKKRYRFCSKEKDEESGLYYYGARYYAPWLCRFVSVDPLAGDYPFYNPYQYAGNQPVNFIDLDGMEEKENATTFSSSSSQQLQWKSFNQNDQLLPSQPELLRINTSGCKAPINYNFANTSELKWVISFYKKNAQKERDNLPHYNCITTANYGLDKLLGMKSNTLNTYAYHNPTQKKGEAGYRPKGNYVDETGSFITSVGFAEGPKNISVKISDYYKVSTVPYSNSYAESKVQFQSVSKKALEMTSQQNGVHVFLLGVMGGFHAMTLIVDVTDRAKPKLFLSDQVYNWTNGYKQFTPKELDNFLKRLVYANYKSNFEYTDMQLWHLINPQ